MAFSRAFLARFRTTLDPLSTVMAPGRFVVSTIDRAFRSAPLDSAQWWSK